MDFPPVPPTEDDLVEPEAIPSSRPCLSCLAWSRVEMPVEESLESLYAAADAMGKVLLLISCQKHGGHATIGGTVAQVVRCLTCEEESVLLELEPGQYLDWNADRAFAQTCSTEEQ